MWLSHLWHIHQYSLQSVWTDWAIYWTLGNFLKFLASINLPKSSTLLGNFWTGVKIRHFSSGNHFWATFIDIWRFFSVHTDYKQNLKLLLFNFFQFTAKATKNSHLQWATKSYPALAIQFPLRSPVRIQSTSNLRRIRLETRDTCRSSWQSKSSSLAWASRLWRTWLCNRSVLHTQTEASNIQVTWSHWNGCWATNW